jgi:hypothetical protein
VARRLEKAGHRVPVVDRIPVAAQEAMSAGADEVVRLPAAHMARESRPDELAEILGRL